MEDITYDYVKGEGWVPSRYPCSPPMILNCGTTIKLVQRRPEIGELYDASMFYSGWWDRDLKLPRWDCWTCYRLRNFVKHSEPSDIEEWDFCVVVELL